MTASRKAIPVIIAVLVGPAPLCAQTADLPFYIGRDACLDCHAAGGSASACPLEPIPAHDRSYAALSAPEAAHIAAINGVGELPTQSRICLACHATAADAGPRWTEPTFDLSHGVQCEACHDAGSIHARAHRALPGDRTAAARLPVPDPPHCTTCHRPRPSHEAVLEQGYRRPESDRLYHTPVNLAISPAGDHLYVVCENSDRIIVLDSADEERRDEIAVGRRPHDVAVSPDGGTLFVTNRASDSLSVIDVASRQVVREIPVGDDPHGVLTDRTGALIFVLNTAEDSISVLDTGVLSEITRLAAGAGPWSLARAPDGGALYVTSVLPHPSPFREPPRSEVTILGGERPPSVRDRASVSEANMLQGIAVVPGRGVALFTLARTKNLVPITRLAQGWTITNGLGVLWPDGRVDQVLLDEPSAGFPDPMDVAVTPDGRFALVTSGGADQVAVLDVGDLLATITTATDEERREVIPNHLGLSRRFVRARLPVGANPRGVVVSPDGRFAYVANALDDSVTVIDVPGLTVLRDLDLGGPQDRTETRWGERLFHSAAITAGQQFSCHSCHPDGHVNGLTFDIEADGIGMSPVDNRTLRGILDTAPFKWEGNNPTLKRQCGPRLAVFFTRLSPYTPAELAALVRYISTIERPPNRYRRPDGLTPAQRRGQAVFHRTTTNSGEPILPEHRCVTCHPGPSGTSGLKANVGSTMWFDAPVETTVVDLGDVSIDVEQYGELGVYYFLDTGTPTRAFDVPHLNNIYGSAPYLHNGAAATLEEVWTRFDVLTLHGATADLTRRQFNDLIAYLKSL